MMSLACHDKRMVVCVCVHILDLSQKAEKYKLPFPVQRHYCFWPWRQNKTGVAVTEQKLKTAHFKCHCPLHAEFICRHPAVEWPWWTPCIALVVQMCCAGICLLISWQSYPCHPVKWTSSFLPHALGTWEFLWWVWVSEITLAVTRWPRVAYVFSFPENISAALCSLPSCPALPQL